MTISDLLSIGQAILKNFSQTPQIDAEVLLSHILGKDKTFLISHGDEEIRSNFEKKYKKLLARRKDNEPIAYITNNKEFYGIDFYINEDVLIPRPETEQLVELALAEIEKKVKSHKKNITLIDIGTGAGNIGTAIISQIINKGWNKNCTFEIFFTDISGKALRIARKNYQEIILKPKNIKAKFIKADLFDDMQNSFDIVVSNPPYIPNKDIEFLEKNVRDFEPRIALDGGIGGVEIVKKLISQAIKRLDPEGVLLFEMHENHPNEIRYFLEERFREWKPEFIKDEFGEWRFCRITRN